MDSVAVKYAVEWQTVSPVGPLKPGDTVVMVGKVKDCKQVKVNITSAASIPWQHMCQYGTLVVMFTAQPWEHGETDTYTIQVTVSDGENRDTVQTFTVNRRP